MNPLVRSVLSISVLSLSLATALSQDVRTGLVAYWPLDTLNNNTTADLTTFGHTLNVSNAPALVPGQRGNALALNGTTTSGFLTLTHELTAYDLSGLPLLNSPNGLTIALWIKGPPVGAGGNSNDNYIITEASTITNNPLLMLQTRNGTAAADTNKLDLYVRTTAGTVLINHRKSTTPVFDNNWHHIAWVDDRGAAKLYVDGVADATDFSYPWSPPSAYAFNTTSIGALVRTNLAATHFNGLIDEVAFWDRPLSQAEVQSVMANSIPLPIPAPSLAIWRDVTRSTNALGDRVPITVGVAGAHPTPPTYQWYQEGVLLPDKTSATLVVTNLMSVRSNAFSVTVTKDGTSLTSSGFIIVQPDPPADLASGLVSYWPLDSVIETPTTNTPDLYYSHTDLQLFNTDSTSLVPGQTSNGLSFNIMGSSQYGRRIGGTPIYTRTNFTIAFWVNGNAGQLNKQVFAEGGTNASGANGDYFLLGTENPAGGGLLNVKSSLSASLNDRKSAQVVFDNTWHHIVWVDQNGRAKLYVDGVVDETDFTYTRANLALSATSVGALYRASAVNFFFGSVDELAFWSRPLTWTEIDQARTSGVPAPAPRIPPSISQQPVGSTNHLGERVTLSIVASGSAPLSLQWLKDGLPLLGQTNPTLPLSLTVAVTNDYAVLLTNIAGALTSAVARVAVLADPPPDLRTGLFYYWPLNTVNASPVPSSPDLISHADLLLNSMDSGNLAPGQFGNALTFYGGQYAARSGGAPIYLATNYSIALWVNGSPQSDTRVYAEGSDLSGTPLFTIGTDNSGATPAVDLYLRTDTGAILLNHRKSTRPVFDGTWHHLLWVDQNGSAKLYVDGVLDETDFSYTRGPLTLDTTAIGAVLRAAAGNFFSGSIDEVAVWGRAVSWTELQQVTAGTVPTSGTLQPPILLSQPADVTNFSYVVNPGATLLVQAAGTGPLSYQWRKDGNDIPLASNPGAQSNVLSLLNLQATDAGGYSVVVGNSLGTVTSRVAQVILSDLPLQLDLDLTNSPNAQPGFFPLTLAANGSSVGGIRVTVSSVGGIVLADRNRTSGAMVANNPPALTQAQIYNDFVFGNNSTAGTGLSVLLENLVPNTPFGLTVWSFDPQSTGDRVSDWTELSSGTPLVIRTNYSFNGSVLPAHDYDNTFGALLTASAQGTLQLQGLKATNDANVCVFVNALRLVPNPTIRLTEVTVREGKIRLTAEAQYPGQRLAFEQRPTVVAGTWSPASGGGVVETHGPVVIAEFPLGADPVFYRAVGTAP